MKSQLYVNRFFIVLISSFFMFQCYATDGYFSLGYGARYKGLAGAGIGLQDVSLINGNPAGNIFSGKKYSVGVAFFNPIRQYTVEGLPSGLPGTFGLTPGTIESDSKLFFIPHLAATWVFKEKNAIAVSVFGHGGMNTDYPTQTFHDQGVSTTGINLSQLFLGVSYSRKLGENHSLGVTALVASQFFEAKGVSNFGPFSSDATKLSNNGSESSFGVGVKIGYMGKINDNFSIGAVYQSKTKMSAFDSYAGLFAEQGSFDIPATWTAGIVYSPNDNFRVLFDVKQILYSGVKSISNPIDPMALPPAFLNPGGDPTNPADYTPNPNYTPLGSDNGSGFGWDDMTVFKIGLEYDAGEDWILRGGYSYGKQPISESEVLFNILAPGVIENHLALGFTRNLGTSGKQIDFSFNYAFNNNVTGFNPFDFDPVQAQQGVFVPQQTVKLEMVQFDFEVGFSF